MKKYTKGILSGIFPVNEKKSETSISSKIHGIFSAIGFMLFLFFPLIKGILYFKSSIILGAINILSFLCAFLFFLLFIMPDKAKFKNTIISYEGLWQRLTLAFMYLPLVCEAVVMILH